MVYVNIIKQAFKNLSPAAQAYCRQTGLEHFVLTSKNTKTRMMSGSFIKRKMFLKADTSLVFRRCLLSCILKEKSQFFSLWFRLTSAFYQGQHNSFTGILMTQSCRTLPLWSCVGHSVSAHQFPTCQMQARIFWQWCEDT